MSLAEVVLDSLSVMAPGPELATALAAIDLDECDSADLYRLSAVRARQIAFDEAQLAVIALRAVCLDQAEDRLRRQSRSTDPPPVGAMPSILPLEYDEFAADQLAFNLHWSRSFAGAFLSTASGLIERLPAVFDALVAGRIDRYKAQAFVDVLAPLDDTVARAIVDRLLGDAENLTPSQLRRRLHYRAHQADPDLARRRYNAGVTARRVYLQPDADGTARLSAISLPPHLAHAAYDRVDRIARRARAAGDPRNLDQLRADSYLDLLSGRPFHLAPHLDPLTAEADHADRTRYPTHPDDPNTPPPNDPAITDHATSDQAATEPATTGQIRVASDNPRECVCGGLQPRFRRGTVDLHLPLTTLMCLSEDPGLIPGWGPVIAEIARQVALDQETNPEWAYHVTDDRGNLVHRGPIRHRPTAAEKGFVKARAKTCSAPGCEQPAIRCDEDHRQEWANNGPSHRANLCVLCRHCHRLRHERGFTHHAIAANTVMWQAPNGQLFLVLPDATLLPMDIFADQQGPPPGYVNEVFGNPPPEDAYGRPST